MGDIFVAPAPGFYFQFKILIGNQGSPHRKLSFYLNSALVESADEPPCGQVGWMIGVGRLANDSSLGVGNKGEELGYAGLLTELSRKAFNDLGEIEVLF